MRMRANQSRWPEGVRHVGWFTVGCDWRTTSHLPAPSQQHTLSPLDPSSVFQTCSQSVVHVSVDDSRSWSLARHRLQISDYKPPSVCRAHRPPTSISRSDPCWLTAADNHFTSSIRPHTARSVTWRPVTVRYSRRTQTRLGGRSLAVAGSRNSLPTSFNCAVLT